MNSAELENDDFCLDLLTKTYSAEVLSWLQDESKTRSLGSLDNAEESIEFIQELFDAGAINVFAVAIEVETDSENSGLICVELPNDLLRRESVLCWINEFIEKQGFEQELNIGRRFVDVMLD